MFNRGGLNLIKETISIREKKTSLSVSNSKISAILRSDIKKTGIRLYADGCLGIAGAIGAYDENELLRNARHMLKFKLPYDCEPTSGVQRTEDFSIKAGDDEQFVEASKWLLETLNDKYPQFMFSHKINLRENEESLVNDAGTELIQRDSYYSVELIIKHRDSGNAFDSLGFTIARTFNVNDALKIISGTCECYNEKIDITEEKIPVVLLETPEVFLGKFYDLKGDLYSSGASMFSGKIGQKLFDDKFSLIINRDTKSTFNRFFDGEGTTLPDNSFALIKNGLLKAPYTSKKIAKQYSLPITGSATLEYDSMPNASNAEITVASSGKTIKELLGGSKAIYAAIAAGGDFTPQGEYASPIQAAYMFDGEKLIGRLPQLAMSSNIYDMFGKDFIGMSSDGNSPVNPFHYLAIDMNVQKIGEWL